MIATLDKFGRIIIPKKVREQLGITPNTSLNIEEDGKRIIIELINESEPIINKGGVLVFTGRIEEDIGKTLFNDRKDRMKKILEAGT